MKLYREFLKLLLMTAVVKSFKYISDVYVVTCPTKQTAQTKLAGCTGKNGNQPDDTFQLIDVNLNINDPFPEKEYRYLIYKTEEQSTKAITEISLVNTVAACTGKGGTPVTLKDRPYTVQAANNNSKDMSAQLFYLCVKKDTNEVPNSTTQILLDINVTTSSTPRDGYALSANFNNNNKAATTTTTPPAAGGGAANNGGTANNGTKTNTNTGANAKGIVGKVGKLNKRAVPAAKQPTTTANTQTQTDNAKQIFIEYKMGFLEEETPTSTTTMPPTITPTETPNNKDVEDQPKGDPNGLSSTVKAIIVISAVAVTGVLSVLIFTFVNRRRHFNQEKEKEELFASLPWRMNNSNANNSFRDIGGGASLPQMENALKSPQQNAYNGGYNTMNTTMNSGTMTPNMSGMNNMNTMNMNNNNMNTMNMNNNNMNTMNMNNNMNTMNMNNNMNTMNMNNNMNTMNMNQNYPQTPNQNYQQPSNQNYQQPPNQNYQQTPNQNYQQPPNQNYQQPPNQNYQQPPNQNYQQPPNQNYQQPPNSMNFMPQQNVNVPPMSTPNMNAQLNTSPVSSNYQNVSTPGSTYAPPGSTYAPASNYNPSYQQPSMNAAYGTPVQQPLQQQPPQQNYQQQQTYPPPTLPQQSFSNSPNQGPYYDNSIDKTDNQSISTKNSGKKKLFVTNGNENEEDQQALLNRTNSEMEEKESINNKNDENNSKNDENNLIDPKRLSKRMSAINVNESNENDCDPDIPVASGYDARELDELTLQIGDKITVKAVYSDGWGWGVNNTTKEEGVFPVVCLARKPNLTPSE